jgi:hypothetical protein
LISIQSAMLVALGFLAASLLGLLVLSAFWSRAVRLTTARIKQSMPVSEAEIKAERDKLRAEYAIKVHKLETQVEQAKLATARQLIEINRRDASISTLETDLIQLKVDVEENQNARRVLEQTVADRLPRVEARLAEAKRLLFNRDREIAELTAGAKRQKLALDEASSINAQQSAEISRLTTTVVTRGGRPRPSAAGGGDARQDGEVALQVEIEALRTKTRDQAALIDRLQRRLGPHYSAAASPGGASSLSEDMDRARSDLSEAEAALNAVRGGSAAEAEQTRSGQERELRGLRARIDDQTGEIARLKAALEVFEQREVADAAKPSKTALRARLGSAQAQADQQAGTISQLRVELAAANERLARQAAHFMKEMRRLGGGTQPTTGRRAARGAERHAYAERTVTAAPQPSADQGRAAESASSDARAGNGRNGKTGDAGGANRAGAAAAQMPNGPGISDERRKPRLLDRLTGIAKS